MLSVITMVVGIKWTMKQDLNDKKNEQNKKIIFIDRQNKALSTGLLYL